MMLAMTAGEQELLGRIAAFAGEQPGSWRSVNDLLTGGAQAHQRSQAARIASLGFVVRAGLAYRFVDGVLWVKARRQAQPETEMPSFEVG